MRLEVKDTNKCVGCQSCMFACSRRQNSPGLAKSCIGVRSAGGMEHGSALSFKLPKVIGSGN